MEHVENLKSLLVICGSNNVVFSVRIFRNCFWAGIFFNCCAMELLSDRCVVGRLNSVAEVKPTYILLFLEIQSPKVHLK